MDLIPHSRAPVATITVLSWPVWYISNEWWWYLSLIVAFIWPLEVTDTDPIHFVLSVKGEATSPPPSHRPSSDYGCGHLWLVGGSWLWNPSPHIFSMWKKWVTVRLQQWEIYTRGPTHAPASAGIFPSLSPYSEEQWLPVVFDFLAWSWVFPPLCTG